MTKTVSLNELKDLRWHLAGVDGNAFAMREYRHRTRRFFEAVEDEDDGYRSMLKKVGELTPEEVKSRRLILKGPEVADVWAELSDDGEILEFTDIDRHVWLKIGTDCSNPYYPTFVFTWTPKSR